MQPDEASDAAFVADTGQAERNLKRRPAALRPLQGAGGASVRERWRSLHARYAEQCKLDAAAKDLPTEILDSKNGLLGAQQLVRRKGDAACHAAMLSSFDLDTTPGQCDAVRLRSSSGGPAGAFLTAIPGCRMTLGNDMFVVSVGHSLGHHVPADVAPPPCKCRSGVASRSDPYHAMVCENVAKMTQMRHDNLANASRLVISDCSCQLATEPRYRAVAGKKGMVECQRQGDIVAVLPRLELAAVDVVVSHASAESYFAEAAKTAGWTVARAERTKRTRLRKDVPDHAVCGSDVRVHGQGGCEVREPTWGHRS